MKFYSKRNCGACTIVRQRLQQFNINFVEIFDHQFSSPTLVYRGSVLRGPITTAQLRKYLESVGLLKRT